MKNILIKIIRGIFLTLYIIIALLYFIIDMLTYAGTSIRYEYDFAAGSVNQSIESIISDFPSNQSVTQIKTYLVSDMIPLYRVEIYYEINKDDEHQFLQQFEGDVSNMYFNLEAKSEIKEKMIFCCRYIETEKNKKTYHELILWMRTNGNENKEEQLWHSVSVLFILVLVGTIIFFPYKKVFFK